MITQEQYIQTYELQMLSTLHQLSKENPSASKEEIIALAREAVNSKEFQAEINYDLKLIHSLHK